VLTHLPALHAAAITLAAAAPAVFNIAGLTALLGSLAGVAVSATGVITFFRAHTRDFSRVLTSGAVVLAGLTTMGISVAGMVPHLASGMANLIFHP
jgi:hypothetical protein